MKNLSAKMRSADLKSDFGYSHASFFSLFKLPSNANFTIISTKFIPDKGHFTGSTSAYGSFHDRSLPCSVAERVAVAEMVHFFSIASDHHERHSMGKRLLYHTVFINESLKTCPHCRVLYSSPPLARDCIPLREDKTQNRLQWERSRDFETYASPLFFKNKPGIHWDRGAKEPDMLESIGGRIYS